MKKIVSVGGGSGQYQLLRGLTGLNNPELDLTSIVSMMDSGGSSGFLRDEYGMLPPGDFMRCLLALSPMPERTRGIFLHRFKNGDTLSNLIYTATKDEIGSDHRAIEYLNRMFNVQGKVLPVTVDDVHLYARLSDNTLIEGETNIDLRNVNSEAPISDVWLEPDATIYPAAEQAIKDADLVIFGPGDLYTSIVPNLLVEGFTDAVQESNARKVYVCNLFTKHGETDNYDALDFLDTIEKYLGEKQIDTIILHHNGFPKDILEKYSEEKAYPVQFELHDIQERGIDYFVRNLSTKTTPIRHNSEQLAEIIADYLIYPIT